MKENLYYVFLSSKLSLLEIRLLVLVVSGVISLLLWNYDIWPFRPKKTNEAKKKKEKEELEKEESEKIKNEEEDEYWKEYFSNASFEIIFPDLKEEDFNFKLSTKHTKMLLEFNNPTVLQLARLGHRVLGLTQRPKREQINQIMERDLTIDPEIIKMIDSKLENKFDAFIKSIEIRGNEFKIFDRNNIEDLKELHFNLRGYWRDKPNTKTRSVLQKRTEAKWLESVKKVFEYLKNDKESSSKEMKESYQELLSLSKPDWAISLEIAQAINDC